MDQLPYDFDDEELEWFKGTKWHLVGWLRTDAWRTPSQPGMRTEKPHGPGEWIRIPGGWDHDHCFSCFHTIQETKDIESRMAMHNGERWLCLRCYAAIFPDGQTE